MERKSFLELLNKYAPPVEYADILRSAKNVRSRADKEARILEIRADFDELVPKRALYEIEWGIKEAYKINVAKILPHYPAELFGYDYVPEILRETESVGVVARGFFSNYDYRLLTLRSHLMTVE